MVDPAEFVLVNTLTMGDDVDGVTAETEVDVWIIVEPKELVVDNTMMLVDVDGTAGPELDNGTIVEPGELATESRLDAEVTVDVNAEVDEVMMVEPKESVVDKTMTLLDHGGGATTEVEVDEVTTVEPREFVVE